MSAPLSGGVKSSDVVVEKRRSSGDIVAVGQELKAALDEKGPTTKKEQLNEQVNKRHEPTFLEQLCPCFRKKVDQSDLKQEIDMDEHAIDLETLLARLGTNMESGLTKDAAKGLLERNGFNKLTPPAETPEIIKFIGELTGFFSLLLWGGSILCFVGYAIQPTIDNLVLGAVLAFVVLLTGVFSYLQNKKSSDLMSQFKDMMPEAVSVLRDGKTLSVEAKYLVVGDIINMKAGDKVPADVRVVTCSDDMKVDNSSLTGEPDALKRTPEFTHDNPLETKNMCFFGTQVPSGNAVGIVVKTGDNTVMGRIAILATATENVQTPINQEIEHFVHIVSGVAIFLGVSFLGIAIGSGSDVISAIAFMIGIIVANVPEGLLLTVTVCLTLTAKRMHKKQVLVKNLEGVETLGSTTCICSDKTGTLTQNIMTVASVVYNCAVFDAECSLTPTPTYDLNNKSFSAIQRCATLCNNAKFNEDSKFEKIPSTVEGEPPTQGAPVPFKRERVLGDGSTTLEVAWGTIGDASESAMIKFCQDKRDILEYRSCNEKLQEIPFNSANKYQVSIHKQDNDDSKPHLLVMKGAPERILSRCDTVLMDGVEVKFTAELKAQAENCQLELSKKGMRVLGFAEKVLDKAKYPSGYDYNIDEPNFPLGAFDNDYTQKPGGPPPPNPKTEEGLCFLGLFALIDPPRPQVPPAVAKCKTAGIKVIMVTGDHPITAKAISKKVGIIWGEDEDDVVEDNEAKGLKEGDAGWRHPHSAPAIVVPGWTLPEKTEEDWHRMLAKEQIVFARTSPTQKLIIVEHCQNRGHIVAVTGDGVNDSPALKKANIGIAMGIMGSAVSKEAADMILVDDNFASIVNGVEEGRLVFDNLKKSIAYTLSSNIPEISPFLCFITIRTPLPLSTILILAVDLGTDMIPAISMAYEAAESDIMLRKPRDAKTDRLVTKKLIYFAYLQIGIIQACAGFFTWMVVLSDYGFPPWILPGLGWGDQWGNQVLYCRVGGGTFRTESGCYGDYYGQPVQCHPNDFQDIYEINCNVADGCPTELAIFYDVGSDGNIWDCLFAARNFKGGASEPPDFDFSNMNTYTTQLTRAAADGATLGDYSPMFDGTTTDRTSLCSVKVDLDDVDYGELYGEYGRGYTKDEVVPTLQSKNALVFSDFAGAGGNMIPYIPWRGRMSPFWDRRWLSWDTWNGNFGITKGVGRRPDESKDLASSAEELHFITQPIGEWSINGPGNAAYEAGTSKYCFCSRTDGPNKVECSETNFAYDNDGGQEVSSMTAWDVNSPEEREVYEDFDPLAFGTADIKYDWATFGDAGAVSVVAGGTYLRFAAHSNVEVMPTINELGCFYAADEIYTESYTAIYQNPVTGETTASTTPMPCDPNSAEYTTELFPRGVGNAVPLEGETMNDGGVVRNWGFWMTNNPFLRMYQPNDDTAVCTDDHACLNIASREIQREALQHGQGAYFISIIIVQWADLLICKTRRLSIVTQGMSNTFMNFGLMFETLLGAALCYLPGLGNSPGFLGTRPLRFTHWMCAIPFSMAIFLYDETRKYLMRATTEITYDKMTGAIISKPGWLERNTYY